MEEPFDMLARSSGVGGNGPIMCFKMRGGGGPTDVDLDRWCCELQ
jgi:hypothetical protein